MADKATLLTFADLQSEMVVGVTVNKPDGTTGLVKMRALGDQELWDLRHGMTWPTPPSEPGRWDGPDKPVRMGQKLDDPKYREAMTAANRDYQYRLLAHALVMDIAGESDADKAAALKRSMPAWFVNQVMRRLLEVMGISDAEVQASADSF